MFQGEFPQDDGQQDQEGMINKRRVGESDEAYRKRLAEEQAAYEKARDLSDKQRAQIRKEGMPIGSDAQQGVEHDRATIASTINMRLDLISRLKAEAEKGGIDISSINTEIDTTGMSDMNVEQLTNLREQVGKVFGLLMKTVRGQ